MDDVLAWMNSQLGIVTALATVTIAIAAVVTAKLTASLISENRLLRKAGTKPDVVAYLTTDPRYKNMVNFVLANIGQGAARNVRFTFNATEGELAAHNVQITNNVERKAIGILPQGERIEVFFGTGHELFQGTRLPLLEVSLEYEDINGKPHKSVDELDVSQFVGLITLGVPAEHEIAEALKKIEQHMAGFASGNRRLKTEVVTRSQR
ncbi:MAG: hypothetical protein ACTSX7_20905 [Alphaproteobacteria bacterium]